MRERKVNRAIGVVLLGLVLATPRCAVGTPERTAASTETASTETGDGRRAPDFAFEDINPRSDSHGETLAVADLYARRGVILNFVASWCAPCWEEAPALQKLHDEERLPIVCVAADEYGPTGDLLRKAAEAKLSMPILHVPKERIGEMEALYDHGMLPATYVIDPRGLIREVFEGKVSESALLERVGESLPLD